MLAGTPRGWGWRTEPNSGSATGRKGSTSDSTLILCNPPYVADGAETGPGVADYEPPEALFAGPEGLDEYRRLAPEIPRLLAPGGLAAIEIGFDQSESVAALFKQQGFSPVLAHDLAADRAPCC